MWPWRFADSILFDVFSVKSVWCWCELWTLVLTPTSNQLLQLDCRVTVISFRGVHLSSSQYFISQNSCTLLCFCNRRGHILYDNEYILVTSPFTRLPKNVVYARLVAGTLDNVFKIGRNAKPRLIFLRLQKFGTSMPTVIKFPTPRYLQITTRKSHQGRENLDRGKKEQPHETVWSKTTSRTRPSLEPLPQEATSITSKTKHW